MVERSWRSAPMVHSRDREEAIDVIYVHVSVGTEELVDSLVVMDCIAGADELVRPSEVVDQFPIMLRS